MLWYGGVFVGLGILILAYPQIVAYIIGIFLFFLGVYIVFIYYLLSKKRFSFFKRKEKEEEKEYISFGKFKIYKD